MQMDFIQMILFLLPPYVANAVPVIFGGGVPIDFKKTAWDGRRILGDGKTYKGLIAGIVFGVAIGVVEYVAFSNFLLLLTSILSSIGAMLGDIAGSFIKRRMNFERGKPSLVMDQILFIVFAIIIAYPLMLQTFQSLLSIGSLSLILVITYIMHRIMNIIANILGLKKVPW